MRQINIFLAEDHAIVREGFKRLVEAQPDLALVGETEDGAEVIALVVERRPDVVILDISMPGMDGVAVARVLGVRCPEAKVLVFTAHEDGAHVRAMIGAGVRGYLLKRASAAELVPAIRTVAAGGFYADTRVSGRLIDALRGGAHVLASGIENLSTRELDVLRFIAWGYTNKEVAATMGVSVKTVETYKVRSMEKMRFRSRVEIVRHANKHGWLKEA